jgi:hypothetical protein
MSSDGQRGFPWFYGWAAWGSAFSPVALWGMVVAAPHPISTGLFAVTLLFGLAGLLAAALSLFGIRSWRSALIIIPGAVLGVWLNGYLAFLSVFAIGMSGKRI